MCLCVCATCVHACMCSCDTVITEPTAAMVATVAIVASVPTLATVATHSYCIYFDF